MTQDEIIEMADKADEEADKVLNMKGEYHPNWHQVRDEIFAKLAYDRGWRDGYTSCDNDNKTLTSALIEDAVEEEREACAVACETDGKDLAGLYYAGVIRART